MGINGQLFDNGVLSVFVPSGWMLFYGIDSDGKKSPKKLHIYKDTQTDLDVFSKVGITICVYDKNEILLPTRLFYDNVQDIEPFELGGYSWKGFTCTSLNYPYTMIETTHNGATFQIMILMKNGEYEILLDDADVKMILESLKHSI